MRTTFLRRAPRVLFCTDTYAPQVNGVSVVTMLSVRGLAERGWHCAVAAPRYPRAMYEHGPGPTGFEVEVVTLPSVPAPGYPDVRLAVPGYRAVADLVDRFRPDLVHSETEFVIGRLGQLAARRRGIPVVSSCHTDFGRFAEAYGAPLLRPAITGYLARFHRRSRRVYTPSTMAREGLRGFGVRAPVVWGRGVDTLTFTPARRSQECREALGFGSRFTFLYVGRFAAEKNVEVVLEAFRRASARVPQGVMRLVLAGTGPREASLRAAAPEDVRFLGYLDRERALPDLFANADAFAFASTTETLGLVVLEAMASGLPVIAAPAGGVADHLRVGINGLSCPADDAESMAGAMLALVGDPGRALELGAGARRTAERLPWSAELDRLDASYREVLAGVGVPASSGRPAGLRVVSM